MRGVNFADASRRALREQLIADLGRIQERIELSAYDYGLDSGWFFTVYRTGDALIHAGRGDRSSWPTDSLCNRAPRFTRRARA